MQIEKFSDPGRFLTELVAINHAINETGDAEQIQWLLVEKTCSVIGADGAALVLTNQGSKPRISAVCGSFPVAEFEAQQTRKGFGARGALSVPGRSGRNYLEAKVGVLGNEIGVLVAVWQNGRELPEEASFVLAAMADQAAIAIRAAASVEQRRQSELFRKMVEEVTDYAIFILDPEGHVASWNSGAERMKGYTANEIIGQHFSCFYPAEERDLKPRRELERAVAEGRIEDEGWRIRKDGSRFIANVVITALREKSGELQGFAKVTRDVTERKRAEEERLHLAREQEALAQSQLAVSARDEFLALLSHELRNPLSAISTALYVLGRVLLPDQKARRHLEIIERQARHLTKLVNDLLDLSRFTAGKINLERRPTDILEYAQNSIQTLTPEIQAYQHELKIVAGAAPVIVDADPVRLEQMIKNLLENSLKYTPSGGKIEIAIGVEGQFGTLSVSDNGIGIDPAMMPRLFDPFTQEKDVAARSQGGLGLGLAVVKRLAEQHGGTIAAHSDGKGLGSKFTLKLPLQAESESGRREADSYAMTVLIADDEPDVRATMKDLLEMLGYRVLTAHDGCSALQTVLSSRPAAAIVDIRMPGLDGYEVARGIRAESECNPMLLIALTGHGFDSDRKRSMEAGFDVHLTKPVSIPELQRILKDHWASGGSAH
ncbi:MAG: ATP-binding protein [Candidatus Binatus sp.]|uniref:hybrid sensor histidine kinase/response regulator n=1 Tax=Candidatus Binatus sp. TaxID=2811406 RepID=UPI0027283491|nr:ATP-binding protein [Candidatus Binatus sp.]MDO8433869.1 ATP-binding protein [Candidatus Binatus sp.]